MDATNRKKLDATGNRRVNALVEEFVALCKPEKVTVIDDSAEDIAYVRAKALENGEEHRLAIEGHSYHFDGISDQARDKAHTQILLDEMVDFGFETNTMKRDEGIEEIMGLLDGIMKGKELFVRFFCLGPTNSPFGIRALQLTDSAYVAHSEDLLYRRAYEEFRRVGDSEDFLFFVHSAGELTEKGTTKNIDKRRVYVDLAKERVFSVNNQYAGNSLGLKKLAFRLAIARAHKEGWLAEHMFLMGVHGPGGRTTYFSGAFPSACGKTSTAMLPGQHMVGDDIIYAKAVDGEVRAVNVEKGVFGIIENVNAEDDPAIFEALNSPGELIFSNVLIDSNLKPHWIGSNVEPPAEGGLHYTGHWKPGQCGADGKELPVSHKNARYTIGIESLPNADPNLHNPDGVKLEAMIYGGRDSDTSVPVAQSLSWAHGVMLGACLESETTAATLGQQGVRKHNPYANLDFMSLPLSKYIADHLEFAEKLKKTPEVFQTNYFLRNEAGKFLNHKLDKTVWVLWAEKRVHGDVKARLTPVGYIPLHEDLAPIFESVLKRPFTHENYVEQFSVRVDAYLSKFERMKKAFAHLNMPAEFVAELDAQIARLQEAKTKHGSVISPDKFEIVD